MPTLSLSRHLACAALTALALSAIGCGPSAAQSQSAHAQDSGATTPAAPPGAIAAVGWEKISMIANWAKTTLDPTGHFITGRNACGRPADGAFALDHWNQLVTAVNASITLTPLTESKCIDIPRQSKMDGVAELYLTEQESSKIPLIDARGLQLCSKIPDPQLVMTIFEGLTAVVETADKEECPHGWGSG